MNGIRRVRHASSQREANAERMSQNASVRLIEMRAVDAKSEKALSV
ncbi:MAG: hypothetical protein AB1742_04650 [bacterium]